MANELTPMMQQYLDFKNQYQDELLFYRSGDFYELFFEDAKTASRELGLTLTGRNGGLEERIPMCGVPYHSVEPYIAKLIKKGFRVAICEQMEDPKLAKGLVKREVIKVITPGTTLNESLLEEEGNRYLVYLQEDDGVLCLALADVSTGECRWFTANGSERLLAVEEQLFRLQPSEIVLKSGIEQWEALEGWIKTKLQDCLYSFYEPVGAAEDFVQKHFGQVALDPLVYSSVGNLLSYLHETMMTDLSQINRLERITTEQFMNLDATAIRNLELIKNMRDGGKKGTLLDILDFTGTSMGSRCLRNWIECPLLDMIKIRERQDAVEELVMNPALRDGLQESLKEVYDLERILSRLEVGSANARDMVSLRSSLAALPGLKEKLQGAGSSLLQKLSASVHMHREIHDTLEAAIVDEPPFTIREGGMIRDGYWYVLMMVRDSNWNPEEGRVYDLKLESFRDTKVRARVVSFTRSGGELVVRLAVQDQVKPILYIRTCSGELGDSVSTLTVPSRAIYYQDNMAGVVVVDGQYQTFIPVNILETRDGVTFISAIQQGVLAEGQTVRLF